MVSKPTTLNATARRTLAFCCFANSFWNMGLSGLGTREEWCPGARLADLERCGASQEGCSQCSEGQCEFDDTALHDVCLQCRFLIADINSSDQGKVRSASLE